MELVLSTYALAAFGGSETYLVTVAQQLERLGHRVTVFALELGQAAVAARERGIRVAAEADELPPGPDAILVQDTVTSLELAQRYPGVPQLFISHADAIDLQAPPQTPGVVSGIVVFNDRVAERAEASALQVPVTRLRQPIDVAWFSPSGVARGRPERLLAFSNYLRGPRRELLRGTCAELGIEFVHVGTPAGVEPDPRRAILDADIVVGYGRSILEAMACGRPAYVFDHKGGDGWVTPDTYPALEADGFGGRATDSHVTPQRLRDDLSRYDPAMGLVNRDLVVAHHAAHRHAPELVRIVRGLVAEPSPLNGALPEVARLSRVQWQLEHRALTLSEENQSLREEREELRRRCEEVESQRRYRLAFALGRALDRARRLRRYRPRGT